jgi:hypothetical protein
VSETFLLYRANLRQLLVLSAVFAVPLGVMNATVMNAIDERLFGIVDPETGRTLLYCRGSCAPLGRLLLVWGFTSAVLVLLQAGALTIAGARVGVGLPASPWESLRIAIRRSLLVAVSSVVALALVLAGVIALIVPGIILAVRLTQTLAAVVVERTGPLRAVARSWRLTRRAFWHTLAALFLLGLISGLPGMAVSILFDPAWIVDAIVTGALSTITTPIVMVGSAVLYLDLRARADGADAGRVVADLAR